MCNFARKRSTLIRLLGGKGYWIRAAVFWVISAGVA
jgi:hypothetical protein